LKKKPLNKYVRFTGIAFQMGGTIYLGSLLGGWLDIQFPNENEMYTKIVTLLAVFASMYSVISQVIKITNQDD
jgi:membrane protein DedA with SNARE-associated domain